jgi:predicted kinase
MDVLKVKTIFACKGIQASGKTSWAKEQLFKYPDRFKRVNKDELRSMLVGSKTDPLNEKFVTTIRDLIIENSLLKGFDVISDDMNFNDKNWYAFCDIAKRVGNVRVLERYFETTLKEAIGRNTQRDNPVPEHIIIKTFESNVKNKMVVVRDEFFAKEPPQYLHDPAKSDAIIVDVDGTLAININRDYFDLSKVLDDVPNKLIGDLVKILSKTHIVFIVSGREDSSMSDTKLWLDCNEIPYADIFMRKKGDTRSDSIVKEEILKEILKQYNVVYVLDDRKTVVDMWRKNNLCCLQVAQGAF